MNPTVTKVTGRSLGDLGEFMRDHLLSDIMPFWQRHAIDPRGGINNCIRDDGSLVSDDRWLWSQWRAVWVFSKLYNSIEPRDEWLDIAGGIYEFAKRHGWDDTVGGWVLRLSGDGEVLTGCDSIYVDAFAIYGLTELAIATGDSAVTELARRTAESVLHRLEASHDQIPHFPYPVPKGARVHGVPMIFSLVFWELGRFLDEPRYLRIAERMADEVMHHFYRADRDLIVERIAVDNTELPGPDGTAVVPGHAIESMWFQIHMARDRNDAQRIDQAIRLIRRHLEFGWDSQYEGILLAVDADGSDQIGWKFPDTKLWWPHTEALYALLLAYEHSHEQWCLDWYERVHDYAFSHYPVSDHGEWTQKLDRRGHKMPDTVVALPVKDPFHLPRALIYCVEVLDRLTANT